ncbi:cytochrome b561 and DOMON domain-containing protein At3g61750-like [Curcuma longa]|uniref:cytochrome b561 and DOMON domain-containing protein At3g61750-like n=1 Tax=Curcuma longa TaxID=136217 RepID=UPI003D9E31F3
MQAASMGLHSVVFIVPIILAAITAGAQSDSCELELPAALSNYSGLSCRPIWNNFVLRYSQNEENVLSIVLSTIYTVGWVGMGFSTDGRMVGSSAMVGWMGKTGIPHIREFYLRGKSASEIVADQGQLLSTAVAPKVLVHHAKIYLAFQLKFQAPLAQQHLLFAIGTSTPVHKHLKKHSDKISLLFDFSTGSSSTSTSHLYKLKRSHGVLAIFGWGVLLPIGAIIARYCKQWDPLWYYLHTIIQLMGFMIGLAAVVTGKLLFDELHATVYSHRGIGIFVLVLGILQVMAFFVKPDQDSKIRRYWNWYHHWGGRLALFFAAVNIVVGIQVGGGGSSWKVGYGFDLAILFIICIILEVLLWTRWSKKNIPSPAF